MSLRRLWCLHVAGLRWLAHACVLVAFAPARLAAAELMLPAEAEALSQRDTALGVYQLPTGPERADEVPSQAFEGRISRRTWRLPPAGSALEVLVPLRAQLVEQGYEVHLDCAARDCGGFDFRFGIEVVPAPDMMVDISTYHFLSASRGDEAVSLLASPAGGVTFLQIITVQPPEAAAAVTVSKPAALPAVPGPSLVDLAKTLEVRGHVVLTDLEFESGSTRLQEGAFPSLRALAAFLGDNPQYRLLLVGHTDTVGSLQQNIGISERRAQAVKDYLTQRLEADGSRIDVAGAGFLAPIASNLTAEGRLANRRVEAVLLTE